MFNFSLVFLNNSSLSATYFCGIHIFKWHSYPLLLGSTMYMVHFIYAFLYQHVAPQRERRAFLHLFECSYSLQSTAETKQIKFGVTFSITSHL